MLVALLRFGRTLRHPKLPIDDGSSHGRLFSGKRERHGGMDARKIAGNLSQIVQTPPRWINSLRVAGDISALRILAEMNPFGKQQEPGTPTKTFYF